MITPPLTLIEFTSSAYSAYSAVTPPLCVLGALAVDYSTSTRMRSNPPDFLIQQSMNPIIHQSLSRRALRGYARPRAPFFYHFFVSLCAFSRLFDFFRKPSQPKRPIPLTDASRHRCFANLSVLCGSTPRPARFDTLYPTRSDPKFLRASKPDLQEAPYQTREHR